MQYRVVTIRVIMLNKKKRGTYAPVPRRQTNLDSRKLLTLLVKSMGSPLLDVF